jgi:hypothetical protein
MSWIVLACLAEVRGRLFSGPSHFSVFRAVKTGYGIGTAVGYAR